MKNESIPKRREKVVTALNTRNSGYLETDARLVEFVKFLMFSKAAELYDELGKDGDIPNWFLFLTLRDNSSSLTDFFHFHLNLVGDSLGLEQVGVNTVYSFICLLVCLFVVRSRCFCSEWRSM